MKKIIILLAATMAFSTPILSFANTPTSITSYQSNPDFSAIYENVGKSVVNINVTAEVQPQNNPLFNGGSGDPMFDYFFKRMLPPQQQKYKQRGLGSGFIISADGYILTNAHVVANADTVTVKLNDKREFKARIVGTDLTSDVALLKIAATNLAPIAIGNPSLLKPGNWVVAIGSPFGLENTITQGIVSALSRTLPDDSTIPFIQTDVPINPGNSGGPLINLNGEVVGINSQIYSKSGGYMGISFSIPIDYAMRVVDQLKTTGKVVHGRLGIAIQPLTDELASSFGLSSAKGALVNGVVPNSPAEKQGIQVGDVILKINDQNIDDTAILPQIVSNIGPGKPIKLTIWRNGKMLTITATTIAAPAAGSSNINTPQQAQRQIDKLGLVVSQLSLEQIRQISPKLQGGIAVQSVSNDAQFAGVANGDIIIGIANTLTPTISQFVAAVNKYKPGQNVALKILRSDGQQWSILFVPVPISTSSN